MGMLGAMAGMGQGLQDFSKLMQEKSKMDWLAQQEAVKHERALSLETLRANREDARAKEQRGFLREERIAGQEYLAAENQIKDLNEETRASRAEALAHEQMNRADSREQRNQEFELRKIGAQKAAQLDAATELYERQSKWSEEEKTKQKSLIENSKMFSPEEKELLKLSVDNKEVAAAYVSMTRSGLDDKSIAEYAKTYREALNTWQTGALPEDTMNALQAKMIDNKITDPTEQAYTYAETVAQQSVGGRNPGAKKPRGMLSGTQGAPAAEAPAHPSAINMKAVDKIAADIKSGKKGITLASVMDSGQFSEAEVEAIMQKAGVSGGTKEESQVATGRYKWPDGSIRPYPPPENLKYMTARDVPVVGRVLRDSDRQREFLNK